MRCPDCCKFVSLDTDVDPEVDLEVDDTTGEITGTVRIVNACQDCGNELAEATFDVDVEFPEAEDHKKDHADDDMVQEGLDSHELELEEAEVERTDGSEGKGRGTRTFYGASATLKVKCSCGTQWAKEWSDKVQASHMDELN